MPVCVDGGSPSSRQTPDWPLGAASGRIEKCDGGTRCICWERHHGDDADYKAPAETQQLEWPFINFHAINQGGLREGVSVTGLGTGSSVCANPTTIPQREMPLAVATASALTPSIRARGSGLGLVMEVVGHH